MANALKTGFLLAALTVLLVMIGRFWGNNGMIVAFIIALVMNGVSYWFSDKIVLSMYHAQEVSPAQAPELALIVQRLAQNAGIPMPRLYIIPTDTPNAFATGRDPNHAAVAVTEGLLRTLGSEEIAGVIGHELAHVRNHDTLISTVAAAIAGAITMIAQWMQWGAFFGGYGYGDDERRGGNPLGMLLLAILAPIAAMIIQMAISRSREYQAGTLSGNPIAVTAGLATLEQLQGSGIYDTLEARAQQLAAGLEAAAKEAGVPACLNRVGSMLTLFFTEGPVTDWSSAARRHGALRPLLPRDAQPRLLPRSLAIRSRLRLRRPHRSGHRRCRCRCASGVARTRLRLNGPPLPLPGPESTLVVRRYSRPRAR